MWMLFSRKAKGAALLAALFSASAMAQEVVVRGNQSVPHQPPIWFVRMAKTPEVVHELESFIVGAFERPQWYGKPAITGAKYPCRPEKDQNGVLKWQFCDM